MNTAINTNININDDTCTIPSFEEVAAPAYGLKWHKFLVNFSLWAGSILNLIIGIDSLSEGAHLYGLVLIGAAVYGIYTRFQLANFKENAYKHLLAVQLLVIAADVILLGTDFSTIASNIAACGVNYWYYKKRSELFVN